MLNRIALGRPEDLTHRDTLKASLAEFISTFIFVFAGQGSGVAFDKLTKDAPAPATSLVAAALAHGLGIIVAICVGANISGGHVNPAVTFGAFIGGHISFFRGIMYWAAQLLGSTAACFLLTIVTGGHIGGGFALSDGVSYENGVILEIVMSFGVVYTVYATTIDAKKGEIGTIAPIVVGSIVAANILIGGSFTGACMNPAVAIGPSLVRWDWTDHWVYWVGPLVGGGLAGIVYELFFISHIYEQLLRD